MTKAEQNIMLQKTFFLKMIEIFQKQSCQSSDSRNLYFFKEILLRPRFALKRPTILNDPFVFFCYLFLYKFIIQHQHHTTLSGRSSSSSRLLLQQYILEILHFYARSCKRGLLFDVLLMWQCTCTSGLGVPFKQTFPIYEIQSSNFYFQHHFNPTVGIIYTELNLSPF